MIDWHYLYAVFTHKFIALLLIVRKAGQRRRVKNAYAAPLKVFGYIRVVRSVDHKICRQAEINLVFQNQFYAKIFFKPFNRKGVALCLFFAVYQYSAQSLFLISSKISGAISVPVQFIMFMIWALLFTSHTLPSERISTPPNVSPSAPQAASALFTSESVGV